MNVASLFVSHGGPNIVTDPSEAHDYLTTLSSIAGKPEAIIVVSAHFETEGAVVVTDPNPGMIYDFGGFAPELYQMVYPAPGEPELAMRAARMLAEAGLQTRIAPKRGYDHGTWTVLKLAYPEADIPIVQISIDPTADAQYHYDLGRALAPLADENVLLVGSGHITHNLRAAFGVMRGGQSPDPEMVRQVGEFTEWFAARFEEGARDDLLAWREKAPYVQENHPTDEHLMPLFFAYGAAGEKVRAVRAHDSRQMGFFAFDSWVFHRA
ncbi:MAG: class III extradiol ring-cleavage dioxygenase [Rhizobiaceae bacterium]